MAKGKYGEPGGSGAFIDNTVDLRYRPTSQQMELLNNIHERSLSPSESNFRYEYLREGGAIRMQRVYESGKWMGEHLLHEIEYIRDPQDGKLLREIKIQPTPFKVKRVSETVFTYEGDDLIKKVCTEKEVASDNRIDNGSIRTQATLYLKEGEEPKESWSELVYQDADGKLTALKKYVAIGRCLYERYDERGRPTISQVLKVSGYGETRGVSKEIAYEYIDHPDGSYSAIVSTSNSEKPDSVPTRMMCEYDRDGNLLVEMSEDRSVFTINEYVDGRLVKMGRIYSLGASGDNRSVEAEAYCYDKEGNLTKKVHWGSDEKSLAERLKRRKDQKIPLTGAENSVV